MGKAGADLGGGCQGCATPPPPEMTCGFLIHLVFCKKNWFIGVEVGQETSAPPPTKIACVAGAKRGGGGGRGEGERENPPIPLPFFPSSLSPTPYPLPLSTPATQATKNPDLRHERPSITLSLAPQSHSCPAASSFYSCIC